MKAFDCLDHELLRAKLNAYGFSLNSLKLVHSYLSSRGKRAKMNSSYSTLTGNFIRVRQGLILGPLLFDIFLIDFSL